MITDRVRDCLITHARREPKKIFAADSRRDIGLFRDMITKPNQFEAARIMGAGEEAARDPKALEEIGRQLAKRNSRPVFVTLGEEGILVCTDTTATRIPTYLSEGEIDTVGAGDSTLSGIVCASMAGASVTDAAILGNLVASITVQQIGTTGTASADQVAQRFGEWAKRHPHLAT
jgi:sugar/nucleoside kinase (ribokinase family)